MYPTIDLMSKKGDKGQSFIELVLIIPVLLFLLAGIVELVFLFFFYLNLLDLTREAARFASARDYTQATSTGPLPQSACTDDLLQYYFDTACFFIDPDLNPYIPFTDTDYSDVTISVFTISGNRVTDRWPKPPVDNNNDGVWSLYHDNWKKDCQGNSVLTEPFFTDQEIASVLLPNAPTERGLVLVEAFACYHQVLNLPLISQIFPTPFRVHAYTLMPAPAAIPTPTPIGGGAP